MSLQDELDQAFRNSYEVIFNNKDASDLIKKDVRPDVVVLKKRTPM